MSTQSVKRCMLTLNSATSVDVIMVTVVGIKMGHVVVKHLSVAYGPSWDKSVSGWEKFWPRRLLEDLEPLWGKFWTYVVEKLWVLWGRFGSQSRGNLGDGMGQSREEHRGKLCDLYDTVVASCENTGCNCGSPIATMGALG